MTAREAILAARDELGPDELEVVATIAERLAMGRRVYGALRIDRDRRDWVHEGMEELHDALVYMTIGLVRDRRQSTETARETIARVARRRVGADRGRR